MGGRHHPGAHFPAEFDQGNGQSRALGGICARAQLIVEDQSSAVALGHHVYDGAHMAGEGGQALGNGLLVADVRQNGVKGRERASVPRGHMEAALGHERQQTDGFQGHGLAAGVGAGDNHGVKIGAQSQGDGHHLFGVDQRVPSVAQLYPALVVHNGCPGPHPVGQFCLGEDHVQPDEHFHIQPDVLGIARRLGGQLGQNALDLLLLLDFQFPQGVVGVDGGHGLHEVSRPRGGHVVNHTGYIIFALGLYRHHIPALPDGDDGLPQEFCVGR